MDLTALLIIAFLFIFYSLFSAKFEKSLISGPMFFAAMGLLMFLAPSQGYAEIDEEFIHVFAEITLILVLFSDAANIPEKQLKKYVSLPFRLLLIGMPLSIILGVLLGAQLFPELPILEVAVFVAVLTPTDAALGHAIVTSNLLPQKIKQTLSVESGLNDGIALPFVLLFASMAAIGGSEHEVNWIEFIIKQLSIAPLVAIIIGRLSAKSINLAQKKQWIEEGFTGIISLATALAAFALSELLGGNGFIAAFVAGYVFGNSLDSNFRFLREFSETEGTLLTMGIFFIFGYYSVPEALHNFNWKWLVYAVLSLTVIRMLPVYLAVLGKGFKLPTALFFGWFGPRGLASILFLLLVLKDREFTHVEDIIGVVVTTVALSIVLHGISANPLTKIYGKKYADKEENME